MFRLRYLPVLFIFLASVLRAESPASQPTSQPAEQAQETPKATLKTFAAATRDADASKLRSCLYAGNALDEKMATAMVELIVSVSHLRQAAVEKFGVLNAKDFQGDIPTDDDLKRIEEADEKIDGDRAFVSMKGTRQDGPMRLIRVDGAWKIPVGLSIAGRKTDAVEAQIAQMKFTATATNEVAKAITDGKYDTPKDAITALQAKLRSHLKR
ncbi:MAG: hypothetical protein ACM359_01800 [Bacillota bacterium]